MEHAARGYCSDLTPEAVNLLSEKLRGTYQAELELDRVGVAGVGGGAVVPAPAPAPATGAGAAAF